MKFCRFQRQQGDVAIGLACRDDQYIADVAAIHASLQSNNGSTVGYAIPASLKVMIEDGDVAITAAKKVWDAIKADDSAHANHLVAVDGAHILAPIDDPQKFFAIAINRHGGWDTAIKPENPHATYFTKLPSCIVGPSDTVRIPDVGQVGPEIELAIIIGKAGHDIPEDKALDHVFGYVVHNDITAHHMRKTTEWICMQRADGSQEQLTYPGRYKNFDTFSPMGPWLVTPDEAPHPDEAVLDAWLNDDHVQHGTTAEHVFNAAHLISYLSRAHALKPGDIISTGTVGPVQPWTMATIDLGKIGGTMRSSIKGLGSMANPIEFVPGLK
ncbi:MAG: fumarylacetoacetate hydrolase family protein [Alphaproteobacteria bacterium]|nr:fumarylacetoacetate hydrolase family protein [Alphaproteobacteria bacterium]